MDCRRGPGNAGDFSADLHRLKNHGTRYRVTTSHRPRSSDVDVWDKTLPPLASKSFLCQGGCDSYSVISSSGQRSDWSSRAQGVQSPPVENGRRPRPIVVNQNSRDQTHTLGPNMCLSFLSACRLLRSVFIVRSNTSESGLHARCRPCGDHNKVHYLSEMPKH